MSLDSFVAERPQPLVALVGCQPLHLSLSRRPAGNEDELQARYLSLPADTKALNYTPGSGDENNNVVLKRDWLHKHTNVVAAVASLWFAWENDTPAASIISAVDSFRQRCRPSCKIVLVLVQRAGAALTGTFGSPASPVKDDERLAALRKQADLDSKHVLILVHTEGEGESACFDCEMVGGNFLKFW